MLDDSPTYHNVFCGGCLLDFGFGFVLVSLFGSFAYLEQLFLGGSDGGFRPIGIVGFGETLRGFTLPVIATKEVCRNYK